ncbi:ADP-ribosylation/crystallin J1 [uncultured Tenacibaculum sp.]|uniref:ADP-ribosylation/crystallin J1 n=1 Tax=uncultured Tenacibaculum sp. TaxID=174713 RepID=UPI002633451C|nr:ADP-ribosylation/crystallin J1 [uncultured Tenacibaculum sp.]
MKKIKLYRPVGEKEMLLIAESGFEKFPSRLEWQPIFYPVLNEEYASEIASKWNTTDPFGNYLGFVTAFEISEDEFKKYPIENVGGKIHNELWVPADQLESFNEAIQGEIKTLKVYIGKDYKTSESLLVNEIMKTVENIHN